MNKSFNSIPETFDVIGKEVFLKVPFYKNKNKLDVIYINPSLYEKVFEKKYDFEIAKKDILDKFSITLESNGNDLLEYGYIDKQMDPTDIALNGNKGSGRAFYVYKNFNIKGEKTPFATSPRDDYNNGKYSLDCAIHEGLVSNVLNGISNFDTFQTLAIIDKNEEYLFPYMDKPISCGLIIRYYEKNELYRFSHRFVNKIPFKRDEIINISHDVGKMEGLKFVKRFLHGAWSIGNLSINCNMIDLDTSFFVTGRHPQWIFTNKFITNYFGYEHKGQFKVLETILNSDLNVDNISLDEIIKIIEDNRLKTIREEFPILIGYNKKIYDKYSEFFNKLVDEFCYLSQLMFDNYDSLNCLSGGCDNTFLFNFSNLFRYYEIFKQKGCFNIQSGLGLLLNKNSKFISYNFDNVDLHEKIKEFFNNNIVDSDDKYLSVMNRALKFVEDLKKLTDKIDREEQIDKNIKLIRAYIENEDKKYLTARKWVRGELIDLYKEHGSELVNNIMNSIIEFYSDKDYSSDKYNTDLYIFEEGVLFREIFRNGYNRYCLKTFSTQKCNEISMSINDEDVLFNSDDGVNYYSDYFSNLDINFIFNVAVKQSGNLIMIREFGKDIPKPNRL